MYGDATLNIWMVGVPLTPAASAISASTSMLISTRWICTPSDQRVSRRSREDRSGSNGDVHALYKLHEEHFHDRPHLVCILISQLAHDGLQ
jgi:hypothetical protein